MAGPQEAVSNPEWFPVRFSALVVFRLQELAHSERILIASGICAVTGFDLWAQ